MNAWKLEVAVLRCVRIHLEAITAIAGRDIASQVIIMDAMVNIIVICILGYHQAG